MLCLELYGRIIISEQYQASKTITPVSIGGVAGGTKYIVNGTRISASEMILIIILRNFV